jgi:hypothetical protein
MFIISEVILGIYIIVAILVYVRRPGRYLARMPISIAAVIALFAPSSAVKDFRETSHMMNKERARFLDEVDCRYGYGSYIGSDGAVHVGIEKVPYVRYLKKVGFTGTRAEKESRKLSKKDMATNSTDYVCLPLEDIERGRVANSPETTNTADTQLIRKDYATVETHSTADEVAGNREVETSSVRPNISNASASRERYTTLVTQYAADENVENGMMDRLSLTRSSTEAQRSQGEYMALMNHDDENERSVSPMEEVPLDTDKEQRRDVEHCSGQYAE